MNRLNCFIDVWHSWKSPNKCLHLTLPRSRPYASRQSMYRPSSFWHRPSIWWEWIPPVKSVNGERKNGEIDIVTAEKYRKDLVLTSSRLQNYVNKMTSDFKLFPTFFWRCIFTCTENNKWMCLMYSLQKCKNTFIVSKIEFRINERQSKTKCWQQ